MQRGFVGCDERENDMGDISTGEVVGFKRVGVDIDPGFDCGDAAVHHEPHGHSAQAHSDELGKGYRRIGKFGAQPGAKEIQQDESHDNC